MKEFLHPLSIYFIWSPANNDVVKPIIDYCVDLLSRDIDKPFSRSMNLPIFFRTSISAKIPVPITKSSEKMMIFVFLSKDIIAEEHWRDYVENLPVCDNVHIIPIALDSTAFKAKGSIKNINHIRAYDYDREYLNEYMFISIAHEIYRWTLNESDRELSVGLDKALKIFISHAKDGGSGIKLAKALKSIIDNSSMRNFFDATDIAQGYKFEEEIVNHIKDSTLISIHSDSYSSRYWCQRELISAKELNRPIIVVDTLHDFEDRRFPFASNVPGVHIHVESEPVKIDLLKILSATLLETLRFFYSKRLLTHYQNIGWFDQDVIICSRPPDISDLSILLDSSEDHIKRKFKKIIYPEPPLFSEELMFLSRLGIEMSTPLKLMTNFVSGYKVGISVSEPSISELVNIGQDTFHLVKLSQDIARYILSNGATVIYGGDLRENGFTEFIFNEADSLQGRLQTEDIFVENYIAWPIYLKSSEEYINWVSKNSHVAKMVKVDPAKEVSKLIIDQSTFIAPTCTQNRFVWSRCLSTMRSEMISNTDIRIFAGGKNNGYMGKMPGILEEFFLSIKEEKPVYLLGGFGGVTTNICNSIINGDLVPELSLDWQFNNNAGLKDIYEFSISQGIDYYDDYNNALDTLKIIDFKNGLSKEDNEKLFKTQYSDEAIQLILKGMTNLKIKLSKS